MSIPKVVFLVVLTALAASFVLTRRPNLFQRNDTLDSLAPNPPFAKEGSLKLASPDLTAGQPIPKAFTADGADGSPALAWTGAPQGTRAYALIMDDPDAPGGLWVHWVCNDLPGEAQGLFPGLPRTAALANGARQGLNSWGRTGWNGPDPPAGKPHRYFFRIYALDGLLGIAEGATAQQVQAAMKGRVLAEASFMATYGRP